MRILTLSALVLTLFIAPGCEKYVNHHGLSPEQLDISCLKVGRDTKETVIEKLGSPLDVAQFAEEKTGYTRWNYPYQKKESVSFMKPKVAQFHNLTLAFDSKGVLRRIDVDKGKNLRPIQVAKEKTETQGYESSVLKDTFGTFGKWSNMEGSKEPRR